SKVKGLASMAAHISNRANQCPPAYRHEYHRVEFLKQPLITEDWAKEILKKVNDTTKYQQLCSELADALQFHEEVEDKKIQNQKKPANINDSTQFPSNQPSGSASSKPLIFFTQPKYAKKIVNKLFPGSELDNSCWNCGKKGHRANKCHQPLDPVRIAARKAAYFEKKNGSKDADNSQSTKQVLFEMSCGLRDLFGTVAQDYNSSDPASIFFGTGSGSDSEQSDESSDSEHQEPNIGHDTLFSSAYSTDEAF
ncbi:MAG: hypothetical protein AAGG81_06325, partial [Chlamydiota bacterium]